jgi:hypothetical protein
MAKAFSAALLAAKNEHHSGNPMVRLYRIRRDTTPANDLFLADYHEDLSYDPNDGGGVRTWLKFWFQMQPQTEQRGDMTEQKITVSNVDRQIADFVTAGEIKGQRTDILLVSLRDLAIAGHHDKISGVVRDVTLDEQGATFTLGSFPFLSWMFPGDRYYRDRCHFPYEGGTNPTTDGRCGAIDVSETCDKSLEGAGGCAGRNNEQNFGGKPNLLVGPHPLLP